MNGNDFTSTFQNLVASNDDYKQRRQKWTRERDNSLGPILSEDWLRSTRGKENGGQGTSQRERDCLRLRKADEEWIAEAKKVHRSIVKVVQFLQSIRRAYLSSEANSGRKMANGGGGSEEGKEKEALDAWKGVSNLTEKERDEIQFQVKVMIKRCLARIKELEKGEEVRRRTTPSLSTNPFSRLLGSASTSPFIGRSHALYAEQLTQHRLSIVQYLSKELAQANGKLGEMQEARLRSQQKKRINAAGSAATRINGGVGGSTSSEKQALVAGSVSSSTGSSRVSTTLPLDEQDDSSPRALQSDFTSRQLTQEQVQQFEQESSAMIKSLREDTIAIELAEQKLSEISDLQTQLIQHLGSQAEVADHLGQEAFGHTLEVGKGNEQLLKAKENNRQASKFLCIFLIGSGFMLLFLHWFD
ncbi:hypothetical protein CBS101457_001703 [Exobasidium rhododendri]|nr:hypothetical protein CBS101457_001703 [Exobasidium rhododendri]